MPFRLEKFQRILKNQDFGWLIILNIFFLFIYLYNLEKYPIIFNDEGWNSNPAIDLILNGKFRTTTFGNFLHLDDFTFWYGPIYFILLAGAFFLFGISLFSGRIVSVILGIIGINIFFKITSKITKKPFSFILSILHGTFPYFFISSRQIRFEIAVSTFSLISFYLLYFKYFRNESNNKHNSIFLVLSGIFSALALLSHPNGVIPIVFNAIGIIIYDLPFRIKLIFSKHFLIKFKEKFKPLIIFGISTILTCLPYTIFILKYYEAYRSQVNFHVTASFFNFFNNYKGEYTRYLGIQIPYNELSVLRFFPRMVQIFILIFLFSIFILSFLLINKLAIKNRNNDVIIIILYIVGIMFIFGFLVYNKTKMYLSILTPYLFISIAYLFNIYPKHNIAVKKRNINWLKKLFYDKVRKVYLVIWIILLFVSQITIILNAYEQNKNCNPYYIRDVFEKLSISKKSVIMGDPTFYIALYDYNFIHYYPMYLRFLEGESFQDLIEEYNPDIIIFDQIWRNYRNDENFMFYFNQFIQNRCVLLLEFNSTVSYMDPISLYVVIS